MEPKALTRIISHNFPKFLLSPTPASFSLLPSLLSPNFVLLLPPAPPSSLLHARSAILLPLNLKPPPIACPLCIHGDRGCAQWRRRRKIESTPRLGSQPLYQEETQQQQQQNHQHQSLASHFHLLHLVESLAEAIETRSRDQQSDALVNKLNNHFDNCQQLLNSISVSINTKAMTVEGKKRKLEESKQLLNQRRDLIAKYSSSVEVLIKSEP
ncbi:mediator of RNA polymerase II transcription subunit 9-like [Malania oleifera]|uniref:mediator of RNA polymerase II transcription subunit 9-like n=1 Tax=Malania oleifera TaxID=397392 RepID=UPI0025AE717A|nr:mediator of RNA polymerase II transcription subunit 9-like [Malania oleifera]